jgi:multisubunit Na+/H+ antiporter MnhG subunit
LILGIIGIVLSALWVFASSEISGFKEVLIAIFTSVTQGVLVAAARVFSNQIYKQLSNDNKGE